VIAEKWENVRFRRKRRHCGTGGEERGRLDREFGGRGGREGGYDGEA